MIQNQIAPFLQIDNLHPPSKVPFPSIFQITPMTQITFFTLLQHPMKHLEVALKIQKQQQSRTRINQSKVKSKNKLEIWSLDPDFIQQGSNAAKQRFIHLAQNILSKKFDNEKYLEQETFREILVQLDACLPYLSSQLQRLTRIEQTLHHLSQSFAGQMKNHLKQFQSLLDSKIRKIKRKEKRTELNQFERMAKQQQKQPIKRKTSPFFINQDQKRSKYQQRNKKGTRFDSKSKKSFGTSNQNQSGSGKNYSGSDSKSGQANALAVLLANVTRPDDKKNQKSKLNQKQQYDFSSIIGASMAVRQRSPNPKLPCKSSKELQKTVESKVEPAVEQDKDEAFIFHRPKPIRKGKA